MTIFDQYQDNTAALRDGLKENRVYFDCDADYILEVINLTSGVSENPKHRGRPFAAGTFRVVQIKREGQTFAPKQVASRIGEGGRVSWHTWLPRESDPAKMPDGDRYNLSEALAMAAATIGLQEEYMDFATASKIFSEDGARVQGRLFGADITGTPSKDNDHVFFNPEFYPVDEDGNRIAGATPEEL